MFLFAWRLRAFEEKKFGAQQPHALPAGVHRLFGFTGTVDVGHYLDAVAVGGDRRLESVLVFVFSMLPQGPLRQQGGLDIGGRGLYIEVAAVAVENGRGAVRLVEQRRTGTDDGRDAE